MTTLNLGLLIGSVLSGGWVVRLLGGWVVARPRQGLPALSPKRGLLNHLTTQPPNHPGLRHPAQEGRGPVSDPLRDRPLVEREGRLLGREVGPLPGEGPRRLAWVVPGPLGARARRPGDVAHD